MLSGTGEKIALELYELVMFLWGIEESATATQRVRPNLFGIQGNNMHVYLEKQK